MNELQRHHTAQHTNHFLALLLLITAIAAGLRLYQLGEPSLWIDEINTVRTCTQLEQAHVSKVFGYIPVAITLEALGVSLEDVREDNIHAWQKLGVTEFSMRLAPALIGILTIPLVALAGMRVFGARGALFIALLLAVAPWHIWMSQSARFYSQQFLFASLCLIWYFHATAQGSRRSMALSMICLVLAFLSQPPALVLVGVFALDWLIGIARREPVRLGGFGWATAVLAMAVCGAALGFDLTRSTERLKQWTQFIDAQAQSPPVLFFGAIWMIGPVTVVFAAISAMILWYEQKRHTIYWSLAATVPIVTMIAASFNNFIHFRYMFVCLLGWLVLAGLGAERLSRLARTQYGWVPSYGVLLMLVTSAMLVNFGYFTDGYGFRNRWKDAFAYVEQHRQQHELVIGTTKAEYYLGVTSVIRLRTHLSEDGLSDSVGFAERGVASIEDLLELEQPAWIVFRADSPTTTQRFHWIKETAELKMMFDTRVQQPYSSIRVYYFDPDRHNSTDLSR